MTAPAHPHPLADLLAEAGVALTPEHERIVAVIEELGYDQGLCSLLRTYAAHLVPAPRTELRSAHYAYHVAAPAGVDERASEGLPSYMSVGHSPADGPFWHCRRHCTTHFGLVDVALERRGAEDHVATFHTGVRDDR